MKFLITGAAGFIGFHTCSQLLKQGHQILGVDNLNDYYEVSLKKSRLNLLKADPKFTFFKLDISNYSKLQKEFSQHSDVEYIIHLMRDPTSFLVNNYYLLLLEFSSM